MLINNYYTQEYKKFTTLIKYLLGFVFFNMFLRIIQTSEKNGFAHPIYF